MVICVSDVSKTVRHRKFKFIQNLIVVICIVYETISLLLLIRSYIMSHLMEKPAVSICENKGTDQLICAFVFATRILQSLYFLHTKFQASSHLLWLYSWFMSEQVTNHCVGFPTIRLIYVCWFIK